MTKKILIVGHLGFNSIGSVAEAIKHKADGTILVVNNSEAKNLINPVFKPEPMYLTAHTICQHEISLKDFPRNQYFDKPKNNYKK